VLPLPFFLLPFLSLPFSLSFGSFLFLILLYQHDLLLVFGRDYLLEFQTGLFGFFWLRGALLLYVLDYLVDGFSVLLHRVLFTLRTYFPVYCHV
jgi:hypothetical protein